MRPFRSLLTCAFLALASLTVVGATPAKSQAYYPVFGGYNYPYYWNNYQYNNFNAFNPYYGYRNYGYRYNYNYNYRYGANPYYNAYSAYPWGGWGY
jgi:hypothetical protein